MTQHDSNTEWKGYSLEEIRFHKMLAMAKADIGKTFFRQNIAQYTKAGTAPTTIVGKLTGALNYFDYALLAYRTVRTLFRHLKRR